METEMRKISFFGLATVVLALGSIDANAAATDKINARHAAMHRRAVAAASVAAPPSASIVGGSFSAHYTSSEGRQDPAFSPQQDEIYQGRF
jgi:hypothetical protein